MSPCLCFQAVSLGMSLNVGDVVKYDDTNILVLKSNLGYKSISETPAGWATAQLEEDRGSDLRSWAAVHILFSPGECLSWGCQFRD